MTTQLPPCGLYRTSRAIGNIPEGTLVYFHNHGEPGPGLYLPTGWQHNRAQIDSRGHTLASPELVAHLEPLPPEGFYRVTESFYCCEKECRLFEADMLVQLGYNGRGDAILFVPEIVDGMLAVPERGSLIDRDRFNRLRQLKIRVSVRPENAHG